MSPSLHKLTVRWRGVFALALPAKGVQGKPVEVYAPSCGHLYAFCIDPDPMNPDLRQFRQLNPKSHVLRLHTKNSYTADDPPEGSLHYPNRTVKDGWDLRVTVPIPSYIDHDNQILLNTQPGHEEFEGRNGKEAMNIGSIWLDQLFIYDEVQYFDLCGSASCHQELKKDTELIITAENPYIASMEHQRGAVDALAKVFGLDMRLIRATGKPGLLLNMSGNCMCGIYGSNP